MDGENKFRFAVEGFVPGYGGGGMPDVEVAGAEAVKFIVRALRYIIHIVAKQAKFFFG